MQGTADFQFSKGKLWRSRRYQRWFLLGSALILHTYVDSIYWAVNNSASILCVRELWLSLQRLSSLSRPSSSALPLQSQLNYHSAILYIYSKRKMTANFVHALLPRNVWKKCKKKNNFQGAWRWRWKACEKGRGYCFFFQHMYVMICTYTIVAQLMRAYLHYLYWIM